MASLLALSRAEQERAKTLLRRRLWAHGGTLVLGLLALTVGEPVVYALAVLALITEGLAWYLRFAAAESHGLAEEGRRRATIVRELGTDPDTLGTASLVASFSDKARTDASHWDDPDYFAAVNEPGPERLRESLQESAFYSCRLYRAAGRRVLVRLGLITATVIGATLGVFSIEAVTGTEAAARAATVILAVLITTDELGLALSYFAAARTSERTVSRLDAVVPANLGQMLAVYGDYAAATALAAPIPTKLYSKQHNGIDAAWRGRARA